ncbi:hypothetical protein [Oribacterium sp. NK2B42]|uniref:hypothetical protein n=1 Tax=Oribacterium sp. NK2B42 TaxID=689781 RepID=UPI00040A1B7B|nr:hypothetical protein [Oribacterium sp. NK2B42]
MDKSFLITIDTEGDNIWNWQDGNEISTENSAYLPRFQALCEKYNFKPTYLTNYEMACEERFVELAADALGKGACEIGMHLHAYNNPPFFPLSVTQKKNFPYLIEYPEEIIDEKIKRLNDLLIEKFGITPRSHRAGRWALNDSYLRLLKKHGYRFDCSVTPGVDWSGAKGSTEGSKGSDYTKCMNTPYYISEGMLEIPVTIKRIHKSFLNIDSPQNMARIIKHHVLGQQVWLRPNGNNIKEISALLEKEKKTNSGYLMFMLHSSELMPGGSPTFHSPKDIEVLYEHIEMIFMSAKQFCDGKTLTEYAEGLKI